MLAAQQPAPKPELLPQLDKSKPPENRPQKAPEREKIDPKKYPRPTLEKHLADAMEPWRKALQPAVVPGNPKAMVGAQTNKDWWSKTATLKYESVAGAGGKKLAEGWGTATWNTTGKLFAEGTFRQDKMHGLWHFYDDKGELESVRAYTGGYCEGPYVTVDASGVTSYGVYKGSNRHAEWLHFDKTGFLYLRVMWAPVKVGTETKWSRRYDANGLLARHWSYREDRSADVVAWIEPQHDAKGKLTNPGEAGRCELLFKGANGKTHGWQTTYDAKNGWRSHDIWYEQGEHTGPSRSYNSKGEQTWGGQMLKGKMFGECWSKNSSGVVTTTTYDEEGLRHGAYTVLDAKGETTWQGEYVRGKKHGKWIETVSVDSVFGVAMLRLPGLSDSSFLRATGEYADDMRTGTWSWHRLSGSLIAEVPFVKGNLEGATRVYHADGKALAASGNFGSNNLSGTWQFFHANGTKSEEGEFYLNKQDKLWKAWHEDGSLAREGAYRLGASTGPWVYYWPGGKPHFRGSYLVYKSGITEYGVMVGEWDYFNDQGELVSREFYADKGPQTRIGTLKREAKLESPPEGVVINPELPNGTFANYRGESWNEVLVTRVVALNGKPHGKTQQFYPNGKVGAEGDMFHDKREGLWKFWHETGVQKEEATFFDGNPKGPYKSWRPDGTLQTEGEYTGKLKTGRWLTYHMDGKQVQRDVSYDTAERLDGAMVEYNAKGEVERKGTWAAGKETGQWESFYPGGQKRFVVNYKEGRLDGPYQAWHAKGQMSAEHTYAMGKLVGDSRTWHETGQLKSEGKYSADSKQIGLWKTWYANGQLETEKHYDEAGKPIGVWKIWDEKGELTSEQEQK